MNILFYYPDKERSVSISTLMIAFQEQGHNVYLLTHAKEGYLHNDVKKHGIKTFSYFIKKPNFLIFYLRHIFYLAFFTRKNKIDIVYSHIQKANLISSFAQFFSLSRFVLCRHHSDCAYIDNNRKEKLADKIINRLGREFIVPSDKVYNQMIKTEKVKDKKIYLIKYAYDFSEYPIVEKEEVAEIKKKYSADLLLIKVARLITEKRHIVLLKVMKNLLSRGLNIKLLLLSDGPERENISNYITQNNLQNNIFMLSYRNDVMNYISAADIVVHVSESEASSNLAKEVGLLKKPLIVCKDVGDFDEYLIDKVNSLMIDKNVSTVYLENLLLRIYYDKSIISDLGENLYNTVIERFSVQNIIDQYKQFNTLP